jgi:hypothetical protein
MKEAHQLRGYQYDLYASRETGKRAEMRLYEDGAGLIARIMFLAQNAPLPASEKEIDGTLLLYYAYDDLPQVLDILRNEKPLFLIWEEGLSAHLSTGPEPIGEGESA